MTIPESILMNDLLEGKPAKNCWLVIKSFQTTVENTRYAC